MKETILITGGSGMIGRHITKMLKDEFDIAWLVRKIHDGNPFKQYIWDPAAGTMDEEALKTADYIINLAGENIAGHRWTPSYKEKIINSRLQAASLLKSKLAEVPNKVKAVICSAAIGIYKDEGEEWIHEESEKDVDFLASTCIKWEDGNSHFNCRTVIFRIGLVLSQKGGILPQLSLPVKFGIAPLFKGGKIYQSWIHIDDIAGMVHHAIKNDFIKGIYNATAPHPVTQKQLMNAIRKRYNRFSIPFPVPDFILKMILGEKAAIVLKGARITSQRICDNGYAFRHNTIDEALTHIQ